MDGSPVSVLQRSEPDDFDDEGEDVCLNITYVETFIFFCALEGKCKKACSCCCANHL